MEPTIAKTYSVLIEWQPQGAWVAWAPEVPGCHTFGTSIAQTTRRIRHALGLFVTHAPELDVRLRLPPHLQRNIAEATRTRHEAERAQVAASRAARQAAAATTEAGMSRRDVAALLHLTPQRIQQLLFADPG